VDSHWNLIFLLPSGKRLPRGRKNNTDYDESYPKPLLRTPYLFFCSMLFHTKTFAIPCNFGVIEAGEI
jgi:hypothetical protein